LPRERATSRHPLPGDRRRPPVANLLDLTGLVALVTAGSWTL